jgi:hypothetical protein
LIVTSIPGGSDRNRAWAEKKKREKERGVLLSLRQDAMHASTHYNAVAYLVENDRPYTAGIPIRVQMALLFVGGRIKSEREREKCSLQEPSEQAYILDYDLRFGFTQVPVDGLCGQQAAGADQRNTRR